MGRRKNKKKSHWSAYNPTDTSPGAAEDGAPGGPAFFHYHPGSSGMNQSWWFNTFGKRQDPLLEEDPSTSTSSETKTEVRNEFPLEPKTYDPKYRQYRPPQRPPSPPCFARSSTATPPPQGPSLEYIKTSDYPSHLLTDPTSSRKLLVLDLNGTLLHRSPHASKAGQRFPILGQEGFQPRLRPVHPRPYLPSFRSYIFHSSTKEWLDVMVWSSAQPHSVHDMVNKCFRDEKDHFLAIWARDTLGLPQHLYNRKVQTLKDLSIPWSKLFPPLDLQRADPHPTAHHGPLSTLLMDDSPRKAELQPYNHLCVKEYSNLVRNRDLASLQEEKARLKSPSPPPHVEEPEPQSLSSSPPQQPVEIPHSLMPPAIHHHPAPFELPSTPLNPAQEFQFDQSVGIQPGATLLNPLPFTINPGGYTRLPGDNSIAQGAIAPQMLFKNPPPSLLGFQSQRPFQQASQSVNPFAPPQHTHHSQSHLHPPSADTSTHSVPSIPQNPAPSVEAAAEEAGTSPTSKKRKRRGKWEAQEKASGTGPAHVIEYDETLLAIVGILDDVRFQSNVASWVKENGLWGPYPPQSSAGANTDAFTNENFHKSCDDVAVSSDGGSTDSGRLGEGKKKRRGAVDASFEAAATDGPKGGSLCAPKIEKENQTEATELPLWFDSPPTMRHWIDRGRKALKTLGIPIEHGLKQ